MGAALYFHQRPSYYESIEYLALDTIPPRLTCLRDAAILHPELGGHAVHVVETYFNKLDDNKNGVLDGAEIPEFLKEALAVPAGSEADCASSVDEALHILDKDGNGSLSKQEVLQAFVREGWDAI
ncbi:unnamed protein product [Symbiodinium pilosum]|uniref:EF-hand domain-containing protein n=1 Tax=Symbiodinium pilosum TaxID=2952 RepID=A0A812Y305_SYMPI|nr:unnamed protein product [Symbiodinium pilosum]